MFTYPTQDQRRHCYYALMHLCTTHRFRHSYTQHGDRLKLKAMPSGSTSHHDAVNGLPALVLPPLGAFHGVSPSAIKPPPPPPAFRPTICAGSVCHRFATMSF
ncbi:hypothetical protein Hypma_002271 [Hypsizygus marmoreus]|uniref:Uncharacterized protein n=1 Tax=Hypsizygus marmoreus TaxID=39966 RepID=A0A369K5E8_HYPMA|nr:hypothetical protein Hypma_002271 [Hypsizygus marmoreus]